MGDPPAPNFVRPLHAIEARTSRPQIVDLLLLFVVQLEGVDWDNSTGVEKLMQQNLSSTESFGRNGKAADPIACTTWLHIEVPPYDLKIGCQ